MAKNRRSGNNNAVDTTDYGNDTAELLNEESARLISGSMGSDNMDKPKRDGRSSKLKAEEAAELADNPSNRRSRRAKQDGSESNMAEKPDKQAKKTKSASEKSGKGTRKSKLITDRAAAEITEDKPQNRVRKPKTDIAESTAEAEGVSKKRAKKSSPAADAASSAEEKSSGQDEGAGLGGCKTRQVMKLIEGDNENLVVFAGKSRVPSLLRGRESLSAMMRRNAAGVPRYDDTEVVNITELTIRYEAAGILDRFNACSCEKCVKAFSKIIEEKIPVRYARISRAELDSGELPERAVPMRQIVMPEMIRQLIFNKKRCFHDE